MAPRTTRVQRSVLHLGTVILVAGVATLGAALLLDRVSAERVMTGHEDWSFPLGVDAWYWVSVWLGEGGTLDVTFASSETAIGLQIFDERSWRARERGGSYWPLDYQKLPAAGSAELSFVAPQTGRYYLELSNIGGDVETNVTVAAEYVYIESVAPYRPATLVLRYLGVGLGILGVPLLVAGIGRSRLAVALVLTAAIVTVVHVEVSRWATDPAREELVMTLEGFELLNPGQGGLYYWSDPGDVSQLRARWSFEILRYAGDQVYFVLGEEDTEAPGIGYDEEGFRTGIRPIHGELKPPYDVYLAPMEGAFDVENVSRGVLVVQNRNHLAEDPVLRARSVIVYFRIDVYDLPLIVWSLDLLGVESTFRFNVLLAAVCASALTFGVVLAVLALLARRRGWL